jgi:hypothetical protein
VIQKENKQRQSLVVLYKIFNNGVLLICTEIVSNGIKRWGGSRRS